MHQDKGFGIEPGQVAALAGIVYQVVELGFSRLGELARDGRGPATTS